MIGNKIVSTTADHQFIIIGIEMNVGYMISATYNQETGNIANPTEIIHVNNPAITTIFPYYEFRKNPMVIMINEIIPDRIPS